MTEAESTVMTEKAVFLEAKNLTKRYSRTVAVNRCGIHITKGEVLALVGGNGAGKSTLSRILSGITKPDEGELTICGEAVCFEGFNANLATNLGIRVVYQELSLCTNLTVYENFYVELKNLFKGDRRWRKHSKELSGKIIEEIFPDSGIDVTARLDRLTIAQQQMVEIARAFSDPNIKLLILDEPTSSLPEEQTNQLLAYIKRRTKEGIAFLYISHRLKEIISLVDRICVIQNGEEIWQGLVGETSEDDLVQKMIGSGYGKNADFAESASARPAFSENESVYIKANNHSSGGTLSQISFSACGGEIIGIAGLEGNGQKELLHRLFEASHKHLKGLERKGSVAYVTGDRKKEGNFNLWSILQNIMITKLSFGRLFRINNEKELEKSAEKWYQKLGIKSDGIRASITELSGGNQQKVLVARAMVAEADIIILDDPTRGVDIKTKRQIYDLLIEAAGCGKLVVFYSSDSLELELCTRTLVMRYGTIVKELSGDEVTQDKIVEASFMGEELKPVSDDRKKVQSRFKLTKSSAFIPLIAMLLIYGACGIKSTAVFSVYGIELLLSGAAPLIILALAQMYIIGLGHVDLSLGYFMGLINVLCATLLHSNAALGALSILVCVSAYACMGVVIYYRNIPAIIMTLGASFIWKGIALTIQSTPGGSVPKWLTFLFWLNTDFPIVLCVILVMILVAYAFYRSKYGTVLKGFGNNPMAMVRSGWSQPRAYFSVYLTAGVIALLSGLVLSGITGASDSNASGTYTLQTIAAVVVGGGYLMGGLVSVPGAALGAVTFSLISSLLGFLRVSTELTAAIQGILLILILAMRVLKKEGKEA